MLAALEHTAGARHKHVVVYEQLIGEPEEQCRRLAEVLARAYPTSNVDEVTIAAMTARIELALMRVRVPLPFDETDVATAEQRALYRFLLAPAADPTLPFDPAAYPFYPGWRE